MAINPIVQFSIDDLTVYGTTLLQRKPVLLDQVGIRRLIMIIEKRLRMLWRVGGDVETAIIEFVMDLMERKACIQDFDVVLGETGCLLYIQPNGGPWITIELEYKKEEKGTLCST